MTAVWTCPIQMAPIPLTFRRRQPVTKRPAVQVFQYHPPGRICTTMLPRAQHRYRPAHPRPRVSTCPTERIGDATPRVDVVGAHRTRQGKCHSFAVAEEFVSLDR